MVLFNAVEGIFSIGIMISLGWLLADRRWFNEETSKLFARLILVVSLPVYMLWNLMTTFDSSKLAVLGRGMVIPFAAMLICYVAGYAVSGLIKVPLNRRGTFRSMYVTSNSIFIGLPVNVAAFGEQSIPYVLLYYIANTVMFWTFGAYGISGDGNSGRHGILNKETLARIFSPPFLGFLLAVLLVLLNIKLPNFIMTTCKYLGNLTTPLSMLFIGIAVYGVQFKDIKFTADTIAILFGRFIIAPLAVWLMTYFIPVPVLMKKVFILEAAMPIMTQTAVVAKAYQADAEYVAVATTLTTGLALAIIPLYIIILSM